MRKPRTFDAMVSEVAGAAVLQLIRGHVWRDIFIGAAMQIIYWADHERPKLNKKVKP